MSNYPAGVTGNEPEINGWPEGELKAKCTNVIPASRVKIVVDDVITAVYPLEACGGQEEVDCPFDGTLDVQYCNGEAVGSCPVCGQDIWIALPEMGGDPLGGLT